MLNQYTRILEHLYILDALTVSISSACFLTTTFFLGRQQLRM